MGRNLSENPFHGILKEYEHWVVMFRDKQVTPGSAIIMEKTLQARSLGDVSAEAWAEFGTVTKELETWLKAAFNAEKFNYLALMMYDPEVHFHVIPRYSKPVLVNGIVYKDVDWPDATLRKPMPLSDDEKEVLKAKMMEHVS